MDNGVGNLLLKSTKTQGWQSRGPGMTKHVLHAIRCRGQKQNNVKRKEINVQDLTLGWGTLRTERRSSRGEGTSLMSHVLVIGIKMLPLVFLSRTQCFLMYGAIIQTVVGDSRESLTALARALESLLKMEWLVPTNTTNLPPNHYCVSMAGPVR